MSTTEPDGQARPLRQEIDDVITYGLKLLASRELPYGQVLMHSRRAKSRLSKFFGKHGPHTELFADPPKAADEQQGRLILAQRNELLEEIANGLDHALIVKRNTSKTVFFGHGRSQLWRELKDFVSDRLRLEWEEFNRSAVAGLTTVERLESMVGNVGFAFLVMTAEDEHADLRLHARENVVHEVGLFQGRLGFRKAIVLIEDGCAEFSNIIGLSQIRFPRGKISAIFEEVRQVLERERLI